MGCGRAVWGRIFHPDTHGCIGTGGFAAMPIMLRLIVGFRSLFFCVGG
jgi:hypothetical protein